MARPLPRRYCVSFRVDDLERLRLEGFRDTFDDPTWRTAFEWLLAQKEVVDVIVRRLERTPQLEFERNEISARKEHFPPIVKEERMVESILRATERESAFADIGYNS